MLETNPLREILDSILAPELEELSQHAPSTRKSYLSDCKRFKRFCDAADASFRPAAPEIVAHFLLAEANKGDLHRICAAIGYAHRLAGLPDPTSDVIVRAAVRRLTRNKKKNKAGASGVQL
jgi:hypothetical protein